MNRRTKGYPSAAGGRPRLSGAIVLAALVAPAALACDADPAPPFTISGTGAVEGLVFFDASEDGLYDPSDGDLAIEGVAVAIEDRGTGQSFSGGTTQSGTDGRFRIEGLPVGTHDLAIDESTVPTEVSICQNPLQVTVNIDETRFAEVRGRPGCLITIAEAKDLALGEFAIVRGIVTSTPGQVEASFTFFQDASAGSKIFSTALDGLGLEIGDQVEIGGVTGAASNDFNFLSVQVRAVVEDIGALTPALATTSEIAASGANYTDPLQGALLRVEKAELVAAFGAGGANIQNGQIDDGSGASIIRIDDGVANRNELNNILTVGVCYDIVGFGANFNGAGQIFPRSLADIEEVPCS